MASCLGPLHNWVSFSKRPLFKLDIPQHGIFHNYESRLPPPGLFGRPGAELQADWLPCRLAVDFKKLEHGWRMCCAGYPPFFGLGLED